MQTNPGSVIVFLAMVFIFATIFSIGVIILLTYLKVVRIKRPIDYMIWGIVGGILISFVYVTLMCNKSEYGFGSRVSGFRFLSSISDYELQKQPETRNPKPETQPCACLLPNTFFRISETRATGSFRIFCSSRPTW
jgi:hypothetical protein